VPLPSHTPTKSNLYLDSSLQTVIREPTLPHSEFHVHIKSLGQFIHIIHPSPRLSELFCNKFIFFRERLLAPCPPPTWRTTSCLLSTAAHSLIHSIQTNCSAHIASYMGTSSSFNGVKPPGCDDHSPLMRAKVNIGEPILPLPHPSSLHGAYLSYETTSNLHTKWNATHSSMTMT
jgi:hypothetical protein